MGLVHLSCACNVPFTVMLYIELITYVTFIYALNHTQKSYSFKSCVLKTLRKKKGSPHIYYFVHTSFLPNNLGFFYYYIQLASI